MMPPTPSRLSLQTSLSTPTNSLSHHSNQLTKRLQHLSWSHQLQIDLLVDLLAFFNGFRHSSVLFQPNDGSQLRKLIKQRHQLQQLGRIFQTLLTEPPILLSQRLLTPQHPTQRIQQPIHILRFTIRSHQPYAPYLTGQFTQATSNLNIKLIKQPPRHRLAMAMISVK